MNYQLMIMTPNSSFRIILNKEVGEAFVKEWQEWCKNVARDMEQILEIHGICDSADRGERTLNIKACAIEGTDLYKW